MTESSSAASNRILELERTVAGLCEALQRVQQLLSGWREAIVELEDFCSEPVRLKNMLAAADQIDDIAPKIRALLAHAGVCGSGKETKRWTR